MGRPREAWVKGNCQVSHGYMFGSYQGSVSCIGILTRPCWTPYCFAPQTRMMRLILEALLFKTKALRNASSISPALDECFDSYRGQSISPLTLLALASVSCSK